LPAAYAAPELFGRARARPGAYSDVYSLGLIFYEMLAGRPALPVDLLSESEAQRMALDFQPPPLDRPDLQRLPELVMQAISKDYRRRPQHMLAFARELQSQLPALPRERRQRRADWRLLAIGLSVVMAISLLLALALSLGSAG
ncbi:MAG: hypothetical protein ACKOC5_08715, partial [Chloroflexota bacterium]